MLIRAMLFTLFICLTSTSAVFADSDANDDKEPLAALMYPLELSSVNEFAPTA
jgi:hypothetical protein